MQKLLSETVFAHTESPKKAAGRALGTFVEIIGFYLIKAWGHEYKAAIERPLSEYANKDIMHNVEFTFHRNRFLGSVNAPIGESISSTKIYNAGNLPSGFVKSKSARTLLKNGVMKNACTIAFSDSEFCNAYFSPNKHEIFLYGLRNSPYAMIECKRVGVEEGMKKGPQTIEKAKQGSYVARTVSSVQRIRKYDGSVGAAIEQNGRVIFFDDYNSVIEEAIFNGDSDLLVDFILTIGIVSNHGNWFTSNNQNKEMRVLAQSYDWLLFLTDNGLASFIQEIVCDDKFHIVKSAFERSYEKGKKVNRFTKTNMDFEADTVLTHYFIENLPKIEKWFNVISPKERNICTLNEMLKKLHNMEV